MVDDAEVLDLSTPRRVHIVGVGGAGMSALASVLVAMGHRVTGSDLKASPVTERLSAQGVTVSIGHAAGHVAGADLVTFSPAVQPDNVEILAAARSSLQVLPRAEVLAAVAATRSTIGVAGTHGKTTTCSMLALILVEAGLRPSFIIGADVNEIGSNAVWDQGRWLVLEADESYGTFTALRPDVALLTSVEPDHLDHYGDVEQLRRAFADFVGRATDARVVCADDPAAAAIGRKLGAVSVGTAAEATYQVQAVELARSAVAFDLVGPEGSLGRLRAPVPGLMNVRNAALATVGALVGGAPFEAAVAALARFAGVPRRFEFRGEAGGVTFVDDYAHLPGEVRATLAAARVGGWQRVVAVFQPHRFSRTAALALDFADAFDDADVVVVTDIYSAGEPAVPGISGALIVDAITRHRRDVPVHYVPARRELRERLSAILAPGDVCLTLGAGDLTTLADELLVALTWEDP